MLHVPTELPFCIPPLVVGWSVKWLFFFFTSATLVNRFVFKLRLFLFIFCSVCSFGQLPLPIALSMLMGSLSLLGLALDLDLGPMDYKIFSGQ